MANVKSFLRQKWPIVIPFALLILATLFYFTTRGELKYGGTVIDREQSITTSTVGAVLEGDVYEQTISVGLDKISNISIAFGTFDRKNTDILQVSVSREDTGEELFSYEIRTKELKDNISYPLPLGNALTDVYNVPLVLRVESLSGQEGNSVTFYSDPTTQRPGETFTKNGVPVSGCMALTVKGSMEVPFTPIYWAGIAVLFVVTLIYGLYTLRREKQGKKTFVTTLAHEAVRYEFLSRQLVSRDFKTKYKRSVLGMFWSLLNPLLTMSVQYVVFSTLFRFDVANYPVYLLSGIVFFNFMSDATSQSMMSIVQNASLINKVYVPKYIYPFTKVLSCGVNFLLSLVALYIMILLTGMPITPKHLFILYGMACELMFVLGVSFLLSALMVYFRDIQFLYGVFLQMWIYLTPLFYPESILPPLVKAVVLCNPMYHFITFVRTIILYDALPPFSSWVLCALFAIIPLVIGYQVFKKLEQRFILYI